MLCGSCEKRNFFVSYFDIVTDKNSKNRTENKLHSVCCVSLEIGEETVTVEKLNLVRECSEVTLCRPAFKLAAELFDSIAFVGR